MKQLKIRTIYACFFLVVFFSFSACTEKEKALNPAPAQAAETKSFVIGLLPEQNVFLQKKRYKPVADYLSRAVGMNVKTKLLDSYDVIYTEMLDNKVDAAFFGSMSYVVMDSKLDIEPIARPHRKDGASTYKGVIFALRGSGITEDVRTWKGRRIALVNKWTTAGYIFPKYHLYEKGVKNFEEHFGKVIYTGSHDASVLSVFKGDADIGCAKDTIFRKLTEENPLLRERLVVLASSAPVPSNTLGMKKGKDERVKARIKEALLGMNRTPEGREALSVFGADHFEETKESEYEPIREMLETLGMKPGDFRLDFFGRRGKPAPRNGPGSPER